VKAPHSAASVMAIGPVIAVLTLERAADAVPLAAALIAGGVRVLEVTLRTAAALPAIEAIAAEIPDAVVGAGTALNAHDIDRAARVGARFIVSPGLTERMLEAAANCRLPFLPGVATASELMRGLEAGIDHFKFFPAEAAGGPAMLRALHGPFADARFCPTGGITAANAKAYLDLPNVACVGGGWLAPPKLIAAGDWDRISELARHASGLGQPTR